MRLSDRSLSAFPSSAYAVELTRGVSLAGFAPALEAEYVRARLASTRMLIRAACVLALLVTLFRSAQQVIDGTLTWPMLVPITLAFVSSGTLAVVAFTRTFERWYLPLANVLVPVRNTLAAVGIAVTASQGQLEALMVLPFMVLGPYFFLGLGIRIASLTVALTLSSFALTAVFADMPGPLLLRAAVFLGTAAAACGVAAWQLEKASRTSFLEGRLIAELALHDALTGLKNRRVFDERLDELWQQAAEGKRTLGILLIDVDHFKGYNDLYGHQAGDTALRRVAERLQSASTRASAVLARYGGEEFAVLLYDTDALEAETIAEGMRLAVADLELQHRGSRLGGIVTISVGVAVIEPSGERRPRGALQLADQALYKAKIRGRNRVEIMDKAEHGKLVTGVFSQYSFVNGQ